MEAHMNNNLLKGDSCLDKHLAHLGIPLSHPPKTAIN
jgi:hypothetical protein